MNRKTVTTAALAAAFLACIPVANYAIGHIGTPTPFGGPHVLPVGFGLTAPSGVYVVGLALVLRDQLQKRAGKTVALALIAAGAIITALFAPSLALASTAAFVIAESVDFGIYSLVRRWASHEMSAAASNAVSIVVDSLVFLSIAFGSLAFIQGQVVGKAWATLAGVAVLFVLRGRRGRTVTA